MKVRMLAAKPTAVIGSIGLESRQLLVAPAWLFNWLFIPLAILQLSLGLIIPLARCPTDVYFSRWDDGVPQGKVMLRNVAHLCTWGGVVMD